MAKAGLPRLAILGAGPIGIEAALVARRLGWPVTIYERGRLGEHMERWGHVKMFSSFGANSSTLGRSTIKSDNPKHPLPGDDDYLTGREHVAAYLAPLAWSSLLQGCLQTESLVTSVGRDTALKNERDGRADQPFRLVVRDAKNNETYAQADVVFDCTGIYSRPRFVGVGGVPCPGEVAIDAQIAHGVEDITGGQKNKYANKITLLIGGGHTAATHACLLADLAQTAPETWVIWLARNSRSTPVARPANDPLKERDKLTVRANTLATRGEGNIEFHPDSVIERIISAGNEGPFKVTVRTSGEMKIWDCDRIIASTGYAPDSALYRELEVLECPATQAPAAIGQALLAKPVDGVAGYSFGPTVMKTTEPNFFILGAKSFGRQPGFFLKTGFMQVCDVFSSLTGKPSASFAGV